MLTKEENDWNFKGLKILGRFNFLPIQIDQNLGRIWIYSSENNNKNSNNSRRFKTWKRIYFACLLHLFYIVVRLVQSLVQPEYFRLDHFVIHGGYCIFYMLTLLWAYFVCIKEPRTCALIFNHLFLESDKDKDGGKRGENAGVKREKETTTKKKTKKGEEKQNAKENNPGQKSRVGEMKNVGSRTKTNLSQGQDPGPGQGQGQGQIEPAQKRRLLTLKFEYSGPELIARTLVPLFTASFPILLIVLASDPSRIQLLYFSLPRKFQNFYTFAILFIFEATVVIFTLGILVFVLIIQLNFLEKVSFDFNRLHQKLKSLQDMKELLRKCHEIRAILKQVRELVVVVELFNRVFPFVIFTYKLFCLSLSTVFPFFSIRHFEERPFLCLYTAYLAFLGVTFYSTIYAKAFQVPRHLIKLKRQLNLVSYQINSSLVIQSGTETETETGNGFGINGTCFQAVAVMKGEFKRDIRRIRTVGLRVGSFHALERTSTPKFVDFALKQVVRLLVSFPKK